METLSVAKEHSWSLALALCHQRVTTGQAWQPWGTGGTEAGQVVRTPLLSPASPEAQPEMDWSLGAGLGSGKDSLSLALSSTCAT